MRIHVDPHPRLLAVTILVLLPACGDDAGESEAPFRQAMANYIEEQKMGVTVHSFEDLAVDGDRASAVVRVEQKGGPGLKPKWKVEFVRRNGEWAVDRVER
ncbi:MAG: hypothetical protein HY720_12060 [Planctomycetes bacterium]|nr:hypothetical protein [Planctomycetota bacterium]